jgi:23S rRNA pseudouridine2604 synthase
MAAGEPLRDGSRDRSAPLRRPSPVPLAAGPVVHSPRTDGLERLNKRLATLGHCSRREADDWIARGWVRVNGVIAGMGQTVSEADDIQIQRQAHQAQAQRVTFLLNKPVGYVSGQPEDGHESAATLLATHTQWREDRSGLRFSSDQLWGLAPAGRLDIDSTGLLVLTQDGRVARTLIGEDSDVEKEYLVRVHWLGDGEPVSLNVQDHFPEAQLKRLRHGLSLDGKALRPAGVTWQNPEQLRFVLREGKKRQIRRMCEAVGLKVVGLKRVRIGQLRLGDLPVGQWRYLSEHERF